MDALLPKLLISNGVANRSFSCFLGKDNNILLLGLCSCDSHRDCSDDERQPSRDGLVAAAACVDVDLSVVLTDIKELALTTIPKLWTVMGHA